MDKLIKYFPAVALAGFLYLGTAQLSFGQSFTDGSFTSVTAITPAPTNPSSANGGELGYNVTVGSWSSNGGYMFVFANGDAGSTAINSSYGSFSLFGPNNGIANGLALPSGYTGNIIADDGAYEVAPLTQVISSLTSGQSYRVSFEWAGAQQNGGYTSATTDSWSVALGAATGVFTANGTTSGTLAGSQTTGTVYNPNKDFTGWMSQSYDFTATASSETLYFFANGTPTGQPPFALLADVTFSTTPVPEPKTTAFWTILFGMLIMVGNRGWRRYRKSLSTTT